eukprot:6188637-Pleurochrysis_carterae.AAC.2
MLPQHRLSRRRVHAGRPLWCGSSGRHEGSRQSGITSVACQCRFCGSGCVGTLAASVGRAQGRSWVARAARNTPLMRGSGRLRDYGRSACRVLRGFHRQERLDRET